MADQLKKSSLTEEEKKIAFSLYKKEGVAWGMKATSLLFDLTKTIDIEQDDFAKLQRILMASLGSMFVEGYMKRLEEKKGK